MANEKTMDMTKGSPLKHIIWFSIPLIIGNIFQQFYSMVDTIIVGRTIDVDALAAVGSTGALSSLIIGFTMGMTNGFAIMVSQRFGAGDLGGVRRSVAMGGMLSAVFAVLITAVSVAASRRLLIWMNTPENIFADAYAYITVIYLGIPATMFYNYLSSVIRALGDSKTPLYFLLVASALNIVLDFVFILNVHMGVAGAALATILSQGVSGLLCLFYVIKRFPVLHLQKQDWRFDWWFAWSHLRLCIPMAIQNSILATGSMAVQTMLNGFGSVVVAGYTAASKIEQLVAQVLISLGLTLSTFVGQNFGAGYLARIRDGVRKCTLILLSVAAVGAVLIVLFGDVLSRIFVDPTKSNVLEVIAYSQQYLNIAACFYLILGCTYIFRNALQGIGNTLVVLIGSAVELGGSLIGSLLLGDLFGYTGVCFSGPLAWTGAAVLFIAVYIASMRRLVRGAHTGTDAPA